jgi:hypothetical protein
MFFLPVHQPQRIRTYSFDPFLTGGVGGRRGDLAVRHRLGVKAADLLDISFEERAGESVLIFPAFFGARIPRGVGTLDVAAGVGLLVGALMPCE